MSDLLKKKLRPSHCVSLFTILLMFCPLSATFAISATDLRDISFYVDKPFERVFAYPASAKQARLTNSIWKFYSDKCGPIDKALMPTWSGYHRNWISDVIVLPCMDDIRKILLSQFQFIDKIVAAQDIDSEDLAWEQAYQLADNFLSLNDDAKFEFQITAAPREIAGVVTLRNSLLAYNPILISYLITRNMNNDLEDRRDLLRDLRETILAELPATEFDLRLELEDWFRKLMARPSFYTALKSVEFEARLSPEAKAAIRPGLKEFRRRQIQGVKTFLDQNPLKGSAAGRLHSEIKAEQRWEFRDADLEKSGFKVSSRVAQIASQEALSQESLSPHRRSIKERCEYLLSHFRVRY